MFDAIIWQPSRDALAKWWAKRDWQIQYCWHKDDFRKFWDLACGMLGLDASAVWADREGD